MERVTGSRLLPIETPNGKITAQQVADRIEGMPGHFGTRPRVVSITQATEYGTVYSIDEVRAIAKVVHDAGLYLHMDGARIANAAVSLGVTLAEATGGCDVDVLSLGGTKNGAMFAEAVLFVNPDLSRDFALRRQQTMQLASKHRYIAAQFTAMFGGRSVEGERDSLQRHGAAPLGWLRVAAGHHDHAQTRRTRSS